MSRPNTTVPIPLTDVTLNSICETNLAADQYYQSTLAPITQLPTNDQNNANLHEAYVQICHDADCNAESVSSRVPYVSGEGAVAFYGPDKFSKNAFEQSLRNGHWYCPSHSADAPSNLVSAIESCGIEFESRHDEEPYAEEILGSGEEDGPMHRWRCTAPIIVFENGSVSRDEEGYRGCSRFHKALSLARGPDNRMTLPSMKTDETDLVPYTAAPRSNDQMLVLPPITPLLRLTSSEEGVRIVEGDGASSHLNDPRQSAWPENDILLVDADDEAPSPFDQAWNDTAKYFDDPRHPASIWCEAEPIPTCTVCGSSVISGGENATREERKQYWKSDIAKKDNLASHRLGTITHPACEPVWEQQTAGLPRIQAECADSCGVSFNIVSYHEDKWPNRHKTDAASLQTNYYALPWCRSGVMEDFLRDKKYEMYEKSTSAWRGTNSSWKLANS
ncbi:hypothetical protein B9479_007104 [Cryptococcus floricola]|uniref:Uncharacterized protein n=1 Tax=Cryptococcus floricola TaxID=2591691 RepID=A0A5D3APR0_9TREE|nr:hypothetical protein B9479_007104 [Cryptococcus floricola]